MKILTLILVALSVAYRMQAVNLSYSDENFNNLESKTETLSVRCFVQDSTGMVWFGTSRGLYSYDGYDVRHYISDTLPSHQLIKCCFIRHKVMLLGGENGISLFNLESGRFSKPAMPLNEAISAFCEYKGEVWIGAESGLYIYNVEQDALRPALVRGKHFPRNIQSLAADTKNLYIGTANEVGCYCFDTHIYNPLSRENIVYISSMLLDDAGNTLWIGTARHLLRMNTETREMERVKDFYVVKTIAKADGNLLIGTDSGLYVYDPQGEWHLISHDAKNNRSLSSDVVSTIFKDANGNIWIGTDNGISLSAHNPSVISRSLPSITGSNEGNQIFAIQRTAAGALWIGGSRGLIELKGEANGNSTYRWYRMNSQESFIPHNRIRAVYEDSRQRLWVASDRGLLRYNSATGRFIPYLFNDLKNWVYDVLETPDGDLWLATFFGVYCISAEQADEGGILQPKQHISNAQGLYSNDIYQLALDRENHLWVLANNHHIDRINLTTKTILPIEKITGIPNVDAYAVISDSVGNIWISSSDHLLKLSVNHGHVTTEKIKLSAMLPTEVFAMDEVEDEIWLTTSEGIFMVNKESLNVHRLRVSEKYISISYDTMTRKVWLGTTDKITRIDPVLLKRELHPREVRITNIEINGNRELSYSARRSKHLKLDAGQNNLTIFFSDYRYADESLMNYAYRLEGYHSQWMELNTGENSIRLSNLSPGDYTLYICPSEKISDKQLPDSILHITIAYPWYFSWYANIFYLLVVSAIVWWVLRFIIIKQQLHKEREVKNHLMAQAKLKMEFFTNIAHELKTPLSLIMAPTGKLLSEEKNKEHKALLELIHENAKKLGSLIYFTIEAYQDKDKMEQNFMPTEIEFVEFSRCIFDSYKENMKNRLQDFVFDTNREAVYVRVDIFKMESILNNLLTNACKFTPEHGSIMLSLKYDDNTNNLYVKVVDTGIGIPEEEIPFVFQRYYQSSRTAKTDKEGTGIGLAIVKKYVEMHNGSVSITSDKNGTTIQLTLPVGIEQPEQGEIIEELPAENKEDTRPLIVIVEDNVSIANFIGGVLSTDYRCITTHNGKNGLRLCMNLLPNLIIADVMMPVMDGIEMCQNIREYMPLATVPIILLTAKSDSNIEYQSVKLNIDAFITKPFDCSLLVARVKQLLGNKERLEQQVRIEHIKQPELKGEISADERLLLKITAVIEEHIDDSDLSVDALGRLMGISQKQLYRKIKSLTGMSTVEYIRSIRLKKAALLFHSGKFSVAEVMYMVGFSNASYFTRSFAAEFGKTPLEYLSDKQG